MSYKKWYPKNAPPRKLARISEEERERIRQEVASDYGVKAEHVDVNPVGIPFITPASPEGQIGKFHISLPEYEREYGELRSRGKER